MKLNNSITTLEPYSFAHSKLVTIDLLKTQITYLPEKCFANCKSLIAIIFPKHLKNIHTTCFEQVYSLSDVIYCGRNPIKESVFLGYPAIHTTILYPGKELSAIPVRKSEKCIYPISKLNQTESYEMKEKIKNQIEEKMREKTINQSNFIQTNDDPDIIGRIGKIIGLIGLIFVAIITFFL